MMNQITETNNLAGQIVDARKQKSLNNFLKRIFYQSRQKVQKTYEQLGQKQNYSASHSKQSPAPYSEKFPSQKIGEKGNKRNTRPIRESNWQRDKLYSNSPQVTSEPKRKILLAYPQQELETIIAEALAQELTTAGYELFMGTRQSICQGKIWIQQLEAQYQQCDCLIFLLTEKSLISELVAEGFKRAIAICQTRQEQKPLIIAIGVNLSSDTPVSYEIQSYLNQIQQWQWHSQEDTIKIIEVLLDQLAQLEDQPTPNRESFPLTHPLLNPPNPKKQILFDLSHYHPLPSTKPELPHESLSLNSHFYIERVPYQQQCYQGIVKPGALIRICAPRQMGKTSLLNRLLHYATEQNYHTVLLDFQQVDKTILTDLNQLVRWFCLSIARQLNLPPNLDDYWDEDIGIKASSTLYLQSYILRQIENPIVIAIEEISAIFEEIGLTQDFLTLLRCWHEKAKVNPLWAKIRLVMVQSTDAYIPLTINQSPLNVGLGINLPPFSLEEVETLVRHHQLSLSFQEIEQLMQLLAGHPYLIRLSLYYLSQRKLTLSGLLETALTNSSIYSDHLHRLQWKLQQHPELISAFRQVLLSSSPVPLEQQQGSQLKSLGLVTVNNEQYSLSCNLYRLYFSDRLLN